MYSFSFPYEMGIKNLLQFFIVCLLLLLSVGEGMGRIQHHLQPLQWQR